MFSCIHVTNTFVTCATNTQKCLGIVGSIRHAWFRLYLKYQIALQKLSCHFRLPLATIQFFQIFVLRNLRIDKGIVFCLKGLNCMWLKNKMTFIFVIKKWQQMPNGGMLEITRGLDLSWEINLLKIELFLPSVCTYLNLV